MQDATAQVRNTRYLFLSINRTIYFFIFIFINRVWSHNLSVLDGHATVHFQWIAKSCSPIHYSLWPFNRGPDWRIRRFETSQGIYRFLYKKGCMKYWIIKQEYYCKIVICTLGYLQQLLGKLKTKENTPMHMVKKFKL